MSEFSCQFAIRSIEFLDQWDSVSTFFSRTIPPVQIFPVVLTWTLDKRVGYPSYLVEADQIAGSRKKDAESRMPKIDVVLYTTTQRSLSMADILT